MYNFLHFHFHQFYNNLKVSMILMRLFALS